MSDRPREGWTLTGRTVLVCFIAFFGVVAGVNGIMIRAATSTFGGVETGSSYKAGLAFKNELAAAREQEALHWQVAADVTRDARGQARVLIRVTDVRGGAPAGLSATVKLAHPADARQDHDIAVTPAGIGSFGGSEAVPAGQWDMVIDLMRGTERVFRSRNRIVLR